MVNLILLFIAILIFVFTTSLSLILFKKQKNEVYNIKNYFPHELNRLDSFKYMSLLILLVSIILLIISGDMFLLNPTNHVNYFLSNVIGFIFIILELLFFTLFYFKFENGFKIHIILSSFFASLVLAINIFGILFILRSDNFSYLFLIPFILLVIGELILLVFTFINGFETSEKILVDNIETNKRKSFIPLALLEWGSIIINFLCLLVFILILIW